MSRGQVILGLHVGAAETGQGDALVMGVQVMKQGCHGAGIWWVAACTNMRD